MSSNRSFNQTSAKTAYKKQVNSKFNRILNGKNVGKSMYPWETLVINRLQGTCSSDRVKELKDIEPGVGTNGRDPIYDICSGSLITNKHILTSAECLLKNRREMEEWKENNDIINNIIQYGVENKDNSRMIPHYSKPECLFVFLGYMDKNKALLQSSEDIKTVKNCHIHDQAFSAISEYNYNLGTYPT